jgi:hypothetical protein
MKMEKKEQNDRNGVFITKNENTAKKNGFCKRLLFASLMIGLPITYEMAWCDITVYKAQADSKLQGESKVEGNVTKISFDKIFTYRGEKTQEITAINSDTETNKKDVVAGQVYFKIKIEGSDDAYYIKFSDIIGTDGTTKLPNTNMREIICNSVTECSDTAFNDYHSGVKNALNRIRECTLLKKDIGFDSITDAEGTIKEKDVVTKSCEKIKTAAVFGGYIDHVKAKLTDANLYQVNDLKSTATRTYVFDKLRLLNICVNKCTGSKEKIIKCFLKSTGRDNVELHLSETEKYVVRKVRAFFVSHITKHFCSETVIDELIAEKAKAKANRTNEYQTLEERDFLFQSKDVHGYIDYGAVADTCDKARAIADFVLDNAVDNVLTRLADISDVTQSDNKLSIAVTNADQTVDGFPALNFKLEVFKNAPASPATFKVSLKKKNVHIITTKNYAKEATIPVSFQFDFDFICTNHALANHNLYLDVVEGSLFPIVTEAFVAP